LISDNMFKSVEFPRTYEPGVFYAMNCKRTEPGDRPLVAAVSKGRGNPIAGSAVMGQDEQAASPPAEPGSVGDPGQS
jgi:hypothetical protein